MPNGRVAGWFDALFARPIRVWIPLDGLAKFELRGGWCFGKGSRRAGVRAFSTKERWSRFSRDGGETRGTVRPLNGGRGHRQTSGSVQVGVSTHYVMSHFFKSKYTRRSGAILPSLQAGKLLQVSYRQHRYHRGRSPQGLGPRPRLRRTRGWVGRYPHRLLAYPVENSLKDSCKQIAKKHEGKGKKKRKRENNQQYSPKLSKLWLVKESRYTRSRSTSCRRCHV